MKIFLTGSTPQQANMMKRAVAVDRLNMPAHIYSALIEMGHEVEWRAAEAGKFPDCDLIWTTLFPPCTMVAPYAMANSWLIHEAVTRGVPVVMFFDDWQYSSVWNQYKTMSNTGKRQITKTLSGQYLYRGDIDALMSVSDQIMEFTRWFWRNDPALRDKTALVVPKFHGWGDHAELERAVVPRAGDPTVPTVSLLTLDPTPMIYRCIDFDRPLPDDRERHWMIATFFTHDKWFRYQHLTWPIDFFGPLKKGFPRLKNEQLVYEETLKRWGNLSPRYKHDGSGYYRNRLVFSVESHSVILMSKKDKEEIGGPFLYTGPEIEALTNDQLRKLGHDQHDHMDPLLQKEWPIMLDEIDMLLKHAQSLVQRW